MASDGDYFGLPQPGTWTDMVDAGEEYGQRRRLGKQKAPIVPSTGKIKLKNSTGTGIVAGRVLQVGSSLLTEWDPENLWFDGSVPIPNGTDEFAIALNPTPSGDLDDFLVSGCCLAQVNITHDQHQYADVDSGNTLLQSKWYGRVRLIKKESTGTGEKKCLVRLGNMHAGPIDVVITQSGGIAPNGSGTAKVRLAGVDASPLSTITVHYTRMKGTTNAGLNKEATVFWDPRDQKFPIYELQC